MMKFVHVKTAGLVPTTEEIIAAIMRAEGVSPAGDSSPSAEQNAPVNPAAACGQSCGRGLDAERDKEPSATGLVTELSERAAVVVACFTARIGAKGHPFHSEARQALCEAERRLQFAFAHLEETARRYC
jgi:hypothetical protein